MKTRITDTLNKKIKDLEKLESSIMDDIAELTNYGGDCQYGHDKGTYTRINQETYEAEIETYCLQCGGRTDA